jgi:hypothetical protein
MYYYGFALATPGNLTSNATPATETDAIFLKAATSNTAGLVRADIVGKKAGGTTLDSVNIRMCRFTTGSTAGTGITPTPEGGADQVAAAATMASRPTAGSVRQELGVFGASWAGPGGWAALNEQAVHRVRGNSGDSIDLLDVSSTASVTYEIGGQIMEW